MPLSCIMTTFCLATSAAMCAASGAVCSLACCLSTIGRPSSRRRPRDEERRPRRRRCRVPTVQAEWVELEPLVAAPSEGGGAPSEVDDEDLPVAYIVFPLAAAAE